ncbi:esterase-like activity of phytase family protein [Gordonia sp. OPL2]|uniref:esterase-like activity of phytase family protein n=1 Tax=Gordonia sp. OPL2 TaxID=2486274 RepID=UPI001655C3B6|nr:esterase-like activity of phytase family protein [Gordonia sp. OPL2]ROZ99111.1 esterase-like activity of phytase family protein [Gordonia sp. OPL2]
MRLRLWGAALVSACAVGLSVVSAGGAVAAPSDVDAMYRDSTVINGAPTFGAISGIDRTDNGSYALVSTDVGRQGPARVYTANLAFRSDIGFLGNGTLNGGGPILGPFQIPPLPGQAQFEGIRRVGPDYVVASGGANQFVRQIGRFGNHIRDLGLPKAYRTTAKTGLNGQRGLTGVAVGPGGRVSAITAGGLKQDPRTSARLITWAGKGTSEHVYRTDGDKVAADVLSVNNTDFLVLERGKGRITRIYWTTTRGAQSVSGAAKLSGRERAMPKKLIFSTAPLSGLTTGNMSGLGWGNWLPDRPWQKYRARILYVVTNNAFAGPTRVHALEVHLPKG